MLSIFLIFNLLYFTNAIPPLPLALKEASVAHEVTRINGEYRLEAEPLKWYQHYLQYNTALHLIPGERAYVFTSVFAPARLTTNIVHEWQHFNERREAWETTSTVRFPISGGRDGGYRGYTLEEAPAPGKWRVNVRTGDDRLIGKVSFRVENVSIPVTTNEEIR